MERWKTGVLYNLFIKPVSYVQTEDFSIIKLICPFTGGAYNIKHAMVIMQQIKGVLWFCSQAISGVLHNIDIGWASTLGNLPYKIN